VSKEYFRLTRYRLAIFFIAVIGFIGRVIFVALDKWNQLNWNDGIYYHFEAESLSPGHFFQRAVGQGIDPFFSAVHYYHYPDALHPPLYTFVLALGDRIGFSSYGMQLIINCLISSLTIVFIAAICKILLGNSASIIGASIACLYPGTWISVGQLTSETLGALFASATIVATYLMLKAPSYKSAIVVGILCGFEALTRGELMLIAILTALFLVISGKFAANFIKLAGVILLAFAITISPWVARNLVVFKGKEFMSTDLGISLALGNCRETYYNFQLPWPKPVVNTEGYWDYFCQYRLKPVNYNNEQLSDQFFRNAGLSYMNSHLSRLPTVIFMRVGRMWQFFDPIEQVRLNFLTEQWNYPADLILTFCFWALIPFMIGGAIYLRKNNEKVWPLLTNPIVATTVAALVLPDPRYRVMSEISVVVLSSAGLQGLLNYLHGKFRRRKPLIKTTQAPVYLNDPPKELAGSCG
jgi:hypothetical protein